MPQLHFTFPRGILASLLTIKSLASWTPSTHLLRALTDHSDTFSSAQAGKSDFEHLVASQSHGSTSNQLRNKLTNQFPTRVATYQNHLFFACVCSNKKNNNEKPHISSHCCGKFQGSTPELMNGDRRWQKGPLWAPQNGAPGRRFLDRRLFHGQVVEFTGNNFAHETTMVSCDFSE